MEKKIKSIQAVSETNLPILAKRNDSYHVALGYLEEGLSVIPIRARDKKADIKWKAYQSRKPNLKEVKRWFSSKSHNIGIVCGCVSGGLVVFDLDGENWEDTYKEFMKTFPRLSEGRMVQTGSGKRHLWVRVPDLPKDLTKLVRTFDGAQIELRANGHYVVAPPSIHPCGKPYVFLNPGEPIIEIPWDEFGPVVTWFPSISDIQETKKQLECSSTVDAEQQGLAVNEYLQRAILLAQSGNRNRTGYWLACRLQEIGLSKEEAKHIMKRYAESVPLGNHPYTVEEAITSLVSATKCQLMEPAAFIGNSQGIDKTVQSSNSEVALEETSSKHEISLLPKNGFLKDYLGYASVLTDAPKDFHLFVGLGVLSTALRGKVYIPFGDTNIYPNIWVVLLAPTSFYRKSYSVRIGRNILDNLDDNLVMADEFSRERFFKSLSEQPQGVLIWSEFGNSLSIFDRSYMLGTKEFLSDIFDCPLKVTRKLQSGELVIERPCISILTCSTPEWLRNKIKEEDLRGGFFNRFIYITASSKAKSIAFPPRPDERLRKRIVEKLKEYQVISGEMEISPEARQLYENWYSGWENKLLVQTNKDLLSGFWTRLSIYTLKFAILFQISANGSKTISLEAMSQAISITNFLKDNLNQIFGESLVFSKEMQDKNRVYNMIKHEPGIAKSKLLTHSHLIKKRLDPLLETLEEEEKIKREKVGQSTFYHLKN